MADARPIVTPSVAYRDPLAALKWLEAAFGFETTVFVTDKDGNAAHIEMGFNGGAIYVAGEWDGPPFAPARVKSPASLDGVVTGVLRIHMDEGLDAHYARAKAAGAQIVQEPSDQFYGDRIYRAIDPEGHFWVFSQPVREVSDADQEAATGLTIRTSWKEAAS
jgi:uncharacterized glyoxalase superfamily protein PhnB